MVQAERISAGESPGNRLTVLLANEQEDWHRIVRDLLEPQGVQTISARSGREALSVIESRPVHVAVLDQQMPQLGGLQVIRLMRELRTEGLIARTARAADVSDERQAYHALTPLGQAVLRAEVARLERTIKLATALPSSSGR